METRNCQNCKKDFNIEPEDFLFYEKIKVPVPTFCYLCRAQRRFSFRNERNLFKIKDAFTGESIFSLYPEESGMKVVTREEWYGDTWDGLDFGRDYDFSRNFFEQFNELRKDAPVISLRVQQMINSPYCANATGSNNCYLCFNSSYAENSMYSNGINFSKDCIDVSHSNNSERCYECLWIQNCYQCYFTINSNDSHNLYFCRDCNGCNDCLGCVNLTKSSYCIFNQQFSKEEYFKTLKELNLNTRSGIEELKKASRDFWKTQPVKCSQGINNNNSSGSYITNCKNVNYSFLIKEGENVKYSQYLQVPKSKDCYDATAWGANMELQYETCLCGDNCFNIKFSDNCWPSCKDLEYCANMVNCSDCFGCAGLKKKQYCVFNKQYEKEEYFSLVDKIKKQMNEIPFVDKKGRVYKYGEFFPIEFSPFGYNNSFAYQYNRISKDEALLNGYTWYEIPHGEYSITIKSSEMPDKISDYKGEDITKEIMECKSCKNAFRILQNEIYFYQKENLPLPNMCGECRFLSRIKDRLKLDIYERTCMCKNHPNHTHGELPCGESFKTGYNPSGEEIVYCEKCYQQEVY